MNASPAPAESQSIEQCSPDTPGRRRCCVVVLLLGVHALLVGWMAARNSPAIDETAHVTAGVSYWQFGTFALYRVNPPLVKLIAAAPVALCGPETEWIPAYDLASRPVFQSAERFVARNAERVFVYFTLARWACIPLSLVGGWICYRWAGALYGEGAGIMALALWCFSPNVMAWASCVTADLGAAALGVLAGYCFWRWLKRPSPATAVAAGLAFGLVQLTKFTWIILFGLWPLLWVIWECLGRHRQYCASRSVRAGHLAVILVLGLNVLNLGYLFEGSFQRLGEYTFVSRTLGGDDSVLDADGGGNRFAETWLGSIPVPLPRNYIAGIDRQKLDFERGLWSYLAGEWRRGGWWYYYLYAAAIKVPLGTWILAALALGATVWSVRVENRNSTVERGDGHPRSYWAGWRNEVALLSPAIVIFAFVSSQTGFSHHFRYVLPSLPFVFIWVSKVARSIESKQWWIAGIAGLALVWSVASSLWVYPRSLSYFNEVVGGPKNGHWHLLDSNIDWGQDVRRLQEWDENHPEALPLLVDVRSSIDLVHYGMSDRKPPRGPTSARRMQSSAFSDEEARELGPQPGWYALSLNRLHKRDGRYRYFLEHFEPTATVGYSIYVYHIELDDANRVRGEMGLPPWSPQEAVGTHGTGHGRERNHEKGE